MELYIEKLVFGGYGLARNQGEIYFVENVLPGERIEGSICGKQGGILLVSVNKILELSQKRQNPPCPYFGVCGGCDWMHINYEYQIHAKREIFIECLKRIGKLENIPPVKTHQGNDLNYRHRAQIKVHGPNKIGFFKSKSNEICSIEKCLLLADELNEVMQSLRKSTISENEKPLSIKTLVGDNGAVAISPKLSTIGQEFTTITIGNIVFNLHGDSFFQQNRFLTEELGFFPSTIINKNDCFVDLYGGSGFFSCLLHDRFEKGILIEVEREQIKQAQLNFTRNGIKNVTAIAAPAENFVSVVRNQKVNTLLIDPPRPGCTKEVRRGILKIAPETIIYISCNPSTQARDLNFFISQGNYELISADFFDMYPHTHHIETVCVLRSKN